VDRGYPTRAAANAGPPPPPAPGRLPPRVHLLPTLEPRRRLPSGGQCARRCSSAAAAGARPAAP